MFSKGYFWLASPPTLEPQWEGDCNYSETCLERPLRAMRPPIFKGPHIPGRSSQISMQLNLSPKTPVLRDHIFYGQWGGLSRQVPLYSDWPPTTREYFSLVFSRDFWIISLLNSSNPFVGAAAHLAIIIYHSCFC